MSSAKFEPSTGQWGWFGTAAGSDARDRVDEYGTADEEEQELIQHRRDTTAEGLDWLEGYTQEQIDTLGVNRDLSLSRTESGQKGRLATLKAETEELGRQFSEIERKGASYDAGLERKKMRAMQTMKDRGASAWDDYKLGIEGIEHGYDIGVDKVLAGSKTEADRLIASYEDEEDETWQGGRPDFSGVDTFGDTKYDTSRWYEDEYSQTIGERILENRLEDWFSEVGQSIRSNVEDYLPGGDSAEFSLYNIYNEQS